MLASMRTQCKAGPSHKRPTAKCAAATSRRSVLLAGGAVAASPLIIIRESEAATRYLEVENLSAFQKADQRAEFAARAQKVLKEVLTGADAPACIRLALHDAGTYDAATKQGGFDGSIALNSEELNRPENASLVPIVEKLVAARDQINQGDKVGAGPISMADTIYLAGKVAMQKSWIDIKIGRSQTASGGQMIATNFANAWPIELGRVDRTEPGPVRVPALDADVQQIREFLLALGTKPGASSGPFSPKPTFWEKPGYLVWTAAAVDPASEEARFVSALPDVYGGIKKGFDISRRTVTRTDYEVDFAAVYNKLCSLGTTINPKAYLYKIPIQAIA